MLVQSSKVCKNDLTRKRRREILIIILQCQGGEIARTDREGKSRLRGCGCHKDRLQGRKANHEHVVMSGSQRSGTDRPTRRRRQCPSPSITGEEK